MSGEDFEYVPLDRTFRELSSNASESDESDLSRYFSISKPIQWTELLVEHRIVILSEAGSGKTEEFRAVTKQLRADGKAAFFLRLENIPKDFSIAFDIGSEDEFTSWVQSGSDGWIFLDSVDEARLRHPKDFELAIKILGDRLQLVLDRAHIFLSGRMSAWRPKTDLDRAKAHFPFTPITEVADKSSKKAAVLETDVLDDFLSEDDDEGEVASGAVISSGKNDKTNSTAPFRVLTLEGLTRDQIEIFAAARGVSDTRAFGDAIERADAQAFAALPQDLEDLVASWLKRGEIGTRRTIIEDGVERRLRERDQERADNVPLTETKALEGAKLLAAAATLGRNPSIQVPDGQDGLGGIEVDKVLPDWSPAERKTLLERPIFDAAIYGSVRFHHRTVREYLTAEWLREMLLRPASRRAIEDMFFKTQYGIEVIVPLMRPVLPWVALYDDRIRERVRRIAPEVLFESGDPPSLPLSTRRELLAEIAQELVAGHSPGAPTDFAAVQRFAHADLTDEIRQLLQRHRDDEEAASFLLRMVWLGQIKGALPEAKQHALSQGSGKYRRIAAIRAVHAVGTADDMRDVRNAIAAELSPPNRDWLNEVCDTLAGTEEEIDWLLQVLARTETLPRYSVDHLQDGVTKVVERATLESLPHFLEGLQRLICEPPYIDQRFCQISTRFGWLLHPAARAVERLVEARDPAALGSVSLAVLGTLPMSRHFDSDIRDIKADFSNLVPAWTELNRALFWAEVSRARADSKAPGGGRVTRLWQANSFEAFWRFSAADFDYFLEQVGSREDRDDKQVAMSGAIEAYVQAGRGASKLKRLKAAASGHSELADQLKLFLHPPKREDGLARQSRKWRQRSKAREQRERESIAKARENIGQHLDALYDPNFPNPNDISRTQWYLHNHMRNRAERKGKWTNGDWRSLIPDFGEEIARSFRNGAILHAHRANPVLRSEGAEANKTTASTIFGLTGLAIEAREDKTWAESMTPENVERAWRFASHELNGFPEWLPQLFAAHTAILSDLIVREVDYEIAFEPDEGMHYVIDDLSWSGKWAWAALGPRIIELLKAREPKSAETLNKLLKIVLSSGVSDQEVLALAKSQATNPQTRHPVQWYAVWTGIGPETGIPAFSGYLERPNKSRQTVDEAMSYATQLFGDRYSDFPISRTAFREPRFMEQLYVLLHRHIRRSEDIDRSSGEAYSPTARDRAQNARDAIFGLLNAIAGKEAYIAMTNIAASETDQDTRRWIEHRARQRAQQDADMKPWTPEQVREFNDEQERTPNNHRELAELAINHLLDLKNDLEDGDESVAAVVLGIEGEEVMRNFLGHELRRISSGRYQIPQEEELADEKRPDLRFHGVGIDGPVPTELKIADKWTGPSLFERLENQLSGDYLRDRRSTRGIFLLVNRGKERQRWQRRDGVMVDFEGIVSALQQYWETLSPTYPGVEEIRVIGIDLTKRFK